MNEKKLRIWDCIYTLIVAYVLLGAFKYMKMYSIIAFGLLFSKRTIDPRLLLVSNIVFLSIALACLISILLGIFSLYFLWRKEERFLKVNVIFLGFSMFRHLVLELWVSDIVMKRISGTPYQFQTEGFLVIAVLEILFLVGVGIYYWRCRDCFY